jgi:hypothetical protein
MARLGAEIDREVDTGDGAELDLVITPALPDETAAVLPQGFLQLAQEARQGVSAPD